MLACCRSPGRLTCLANNQIPELELGVLAGVLTDDRQGDTADGERVVHHLAANHAVHLERERVVVSDDAQRVPAG